MEAETQKLEYSSNLGTHVASFRYAADAVDEVKQLLNAVKNPTSAKLVFQSLPKQMRRRAMSHHPKRLPRKYRMAHCAQMAKAGKPQKTRRPSRKYRRRPQNLLTEYLRRQRQNVWLETHIWHARRFHMINRWGYRLSYASCDKTYRASYRASANHCLLQDISFHACIELRGTIAKLQAGFARITSNKCGLGITAKTYITGRREGSIDLFADGKYPDGALGRIPFIWRPLDTAKDLNSSLQIERTIWLWIHPSCYTRILEELINVFQLVPTKTTKVEITASESTGVGATKDEANTMKTQKKKTLKRERQLQFMTRTVGYERIKRYMNGRDCIHLTELKDVMNRFRLTGPLSQPLLSNVFKTKNYMPQKSNSNISDWFQTLLKDNEDYRKIHDIQATFWEKCSQLHSPVELMSNMVIALNIVDPRLNRPQIRIKALPQNSMPQTQEAAELFVNTPECMHYSPIWNETLRDDIERSMLTIREYCELRGKHAIVPAMRCKLEQTLQAVPVLLIQRPGIQKQGQYNRFGYGCGWDVIAPAGYGMPIWLSLIAWGARPGGLREFDSVAVESGTEQYLPDTVAGSQFATERHHELYTKYFRLPPNKRCNYNKLAIVSPFRAPLKQLIRDWLPTETELSTKANGFHILRDRMLLEKLAICLDKQEKNIPIEIPLNALIQVQLCMKSRGNMQPFSLICLPIRNDFKNNLKQIRSEDHEPVYSEPQRPDLNEKERKLVRRQHKRLLKRLRAKRVRVKRKLQETREKRVLIQPAGTSTLVSAQFKKMCNLWLPNENCFVLNSVRKQCTREVFGYVNHASFNFTKATVCGVGYMTLAGLKELMQRCKSTDIKPMCLVRSPNSRHYRFASFKLNLGV